VAAAVSSEPHGTAGEEASRLFEALERAAAAWSRGRSATPPRRDDGAAEDGVGPTAAAGAVSDPGLHAATCGVCPLCRALGRLAEGKPEVVSHLADATTALAAAISALVADNQPPRPAERRPPRRHEHIDIGE